MWGGWAEGAILQQPTPKWGPGKDKGSRGTALQQPTPKWGPGSSKDSRGTVLQQPTPKWGPGKDKGSSRREEGKSQKGEGKTRRPRIALTADNVKQRSKHRREKMSMSDRSNTLRDPHGHRMPYYHRRGRVRPGALRSITDNFVPKWKVKRMTEGAQYSQAKGDGNFTFDSREWNERKFSACGRNEIGSEGGFFTHPP